MKRLCNLYVEEFDEETLYEEYLKRDGSLHNLLCMSDHHPTLTDVCNSQKKNKKSNKTELWYKSKVPLYTFDQMFVM